MVGVLNESLKRKTSAHGLKTMLKALLNGIRERALIDTAGMLTKYFKVFEQNNKSYYNFLIVTNGYRTKCHLTLNIFICRHCTPLRGGLNICLANFNFNFICQTK